LPHEQPVPFLPRLDVSLKHASPTSEESRSQPNPVIRKVRGRQVI
jgi:hypothetical protein